MPGIVKADDLAIPAGRWQAPFPDSGAAPLTVGDSLAFEQVLGIVRAHHPLFRETRVRFQAATALVRQARLRPNPDLAFDVEQFSGGYDGFSQAEMFASVSQRLELFGKRGARAAAARVGVSQAEWQNQTAVFALYVEARIRFASVLHAQQRLQLMRESEQLAGELAESARQRVTSGAALVADQLLGLLAVRQAHLDVQQAETELNIARRSLAALWGGSEQDVRAVRGSIWVPARTPSIEAADTLVSYALPLHSLTLESNRLRTQSLAERSAARPDLTVGGGVKRIEADNTNTFLFGVSFPLPLFNRNQGSITALEALQSATDEQRRAETWRVQAQVRGLLERANQLTVRYQVIDTALTPQYEETFETLRAAYQTGRLSYADLLESQRQLVALRLERNDLALEINETVAEFERLTGVDGRSFMEGNGDN
jgi:cobalt-zinc-cadmium efflux system outer membrane protein